MSIRSQLIRASSYACLVIIAVGPIYGEDKTPPKTKPISQNNRSSQSSRYGDRLQQMKSRSNTSSSTSRSSSVTRTSPTRSQSSSSTSRSSSSVRPTTRSSSNSSAVSRGRSSSPSSYDRSSSSSSSSYRRNTSPNSSSSSRNSTVTQPSTSNRNSSSYSRSTSPSSSSSYRRTPNPTSSSSLKRSRSSSSPSTSSRTRSALPSTSYNRSSSNTGSSSFDRSRSTNSSSSYGQGNDRRSSSSLNSRTRSNSVVTPNTYDRNRSSSTSLDRRTATSSTRGDLNRSSSSTNRNRNKSTSGRSNSRDSNNHTTHNRNYGNNSSDRYAHSRNNNHDRNKLMHSGYSNRYVFDFHRYKDSRHYNHDRFIRGAYCPFYDRLYHDSYFNRRYYSPALFSTIILSAGVSNTVNDNYAYGNYTTYKSSEPYVELYEHSGFRGESLQVYAGEAIYNLKDIRFGNYKSFNDRFSSIKIYGEVTVILYIDSDFGGDYIYLHGSHIDFNRDGYLREFNDEISSIEVLPGIIHEVDHRHGSRDYLLNSHLLESSPYQEPPSTSAYIAPGAQSAPLVPSNSLGNTGMHAPQTRVILYDQPNYKGNQIILTPGDVHVDLLSLSKGLAGTWNDCVASILIEGNTEIFVYCDREFRGDGIAIRSSVPNMAVDTSLVPFVNRVSSVVVNPGY